MRAPATDGFMSIGLSTRGDARRLGSLRCIYKFSSRKYSGDPCCNCGASVFCVCFSFLVRGFVAFSELPKFSGFIEYDIALCPWFDVVILVHSGVQPRDGGLDESRFRLVGFRPPSFSRSVDLGGIGPATDCLQVSKNSGPPAIVAFPVWLTRPELSELRWLCHRVLLSFFLSRCRCRCVSRSTCRCFAVAQPKLS